MTNKNITSFLGLVDAYKTRPSALLSITDPYLSYCFDEACAYILLKLKNGEEPNFDKLKGKKNFSNFTDFYKQFK